MIVVSNDNVTTIASKRMPIGCSLLFGVVIVICLVIVFGLDTARVTVHGIALDLDLGLVHGLVVSRIYSLLLGVVFGVVLGVVLCRRLLVLFLALCMALV